MNDIPNNVDSMHTYYLEIQVLKNINFSSINYSFINKNYLLSCDAIFHMLSGSTPALSFCNATRNVPFSFKVVYNVRTPIMIKYLLH